MEAMEIEQRFGLAWLDLAWLARLARFGLVWLGLAWLAWVALVAYSVLSCWLIVGLLSALLALLWLLLWLIVGFVGSVGFVPGFCSLLAFLFWAL